MLNTISGLAEIVGKLQGLQGNFPLSLQQTAQQVFPLQNDTPNAMVVPRKEAAILSFASRVIQEPSEDGTHLLHKVTGLPEREVLKHLVWRHWRSKQVDSGSNSAGNPLV